MKSKNKAPLLIRLPFVIILSFLLVIGIFLINCNIDKVEQHENYGQIEILRKSFPNAISINYTGCCSEWNIVYKDRIEKYWMYLAKQPQLKSTELNQK